MSDISELKFDKKNFNKHTPEGMGLLEKSLNKFGAGRSILVDKDNNIIAGNGIVEAAQNAGITKTRIVETTGDELVVVKRKDVVLDSDQGREMALADNATAAADLAWDEDNLKDTFTEEQLGAWDVELEWNDVETEEDEAPEVDETTADSVLGGVYQLGRHRLMCGDSTNAEQVAILMDGQKADMVFTDPPYGVAYSGGMQFKDGVAIKNNREEIMNDRQLIYDKSLGNLVPYIEDGAWYVCYASSFSIEVLSQLRSIGLEQRAIIVWNKTNTGYGDLNSNYKNNYEPIFYGTKTGKSTHFVRKENEDYVDEFESIYYGVKKGKGAHFVGDTTQTTVWSIDKPRNNELHPTMKPLALCANAIFNSSKAGELVVDIFGGSGSTLIACEQLGRTCYMMELDPHYCDVIRKRYWKLTTGSEEGWEDGTQ